MRVALFADLHAHPWSDFSALVEYDRGGVKLQVNSRLLDAIGVIDTITAFCRKRSVGAVIMAGDLYHRKRYLDAVTFNLVTEAMWRLAGQVSRVIVLAGNHDQGDREGGPFANSIWALAGHRRVTVLAQPAVVDLGGVAWHLCPYVRDADALKRALEEADAAGAQCHVLHAGIDGASVGDIEYRPREPLTEGDLPARPVYSGHYHRPQTLPGGAVYVGSPLETTRGDGYHPQRGFLYFPSSADPSRYRRVAIRGPRFVRYVAGEAVPDVRGAFVDLVVRSREVDVPRERRRLLRAGARAVSAPHYQLSVEAQEPRLRVAKPGGRVLPSLQDLTRAYVDAMAPAGLSRETLMEIAQTALESANEAD